MAVSITTKVLDISPYIREGSGLKLRGVTLNIFHGSISPYIREGSGLKQENDTWSRRHRQISPYIREGSGLKLVRYALLFSPKKNLPLHP